MSECVCVRERDKRVSAKVRKRVHGERQSVLVYLCVSVLVHMSRHLQSIIIAFI